MIEDKNKSLKKSVNKETEKNYDRKEYQISSDNSLFSLIVEIDNNYIQFTAQELNIITNCIFKNKYELSHIVTKLNLVQNKYTSLSKLLRFVDKAFSKNKISIKQKSENELYLIFEVPVDFEEEKYGLTLKKKLLDDKEILSILIEQINKLNSNNTIVKKKFKEIEKQINKISNKNNLGRGSESSDINEEINIIKQQLNDINGKLSGTKIISDNIKTRNNNNNNSNDKYILQKSTFSKQSDNNFNYNYNPYRSQNINKIEKFGQKEEEEEDSDDDIEDEYKKENKNKSKYKYNNSRYPENNEEIYEKDERPEIYLNNNKKSLKKSTNKEKRNGSQDNYKERDRKRDKEKEKERERENEREKEREKEVDNINIKNSLKKSQKDINELKKSNRYKINEDIKDEQKYENNKNSKSQNKPKIKYVNGQQSNIIYKNDKPNDNINNNYNYNTIEINKNKNKNISINKSKNNINDKKNPNNLPLLKSKNKIKLSKQSTFKKDNNSNIKVEEKVTSNLKKQINNLENDKKKKPPHKIKKNQKEKEEYLNKMNNEYNSSPIKLKYKNDICKTNTSCGWNDMFEIYISYLNNKEYLASPDNNNYNINIISLIDNKLVTSLKGHDNKIRTIRYFMGENNENEDNENSIQNEYLISADDNHIVIVWDLLDNYEIKQKIDTNYEDDIYSCLIFINKNNYDENYIITSTYCTSSDIQNSATKIYSLENGEYIFYIKESNFDNIYYLLLWYNKQNNKNYLIQFSYKKIIINYLEPKSNEQYAKFIHEPENEHYSGFIFSKNNLDFLCSSCYNGYIHIWDLYNKKIVTIIDTKCILCHIIQWNERYAISADFENKSFIVIDLEEKKIFNDFSVEHTMEVKCIKKIMHPKFGECLLTAGRDNIIKLWKL